MEKSSLKLVSNIALKSKYEKIPHRYIPFDLLPRNYHDVRMDTELSEYQRIQKIKQLFAAEYTIRDDSIDSDTDDC